MNNLEKYILSVLVIVVIGSGYFIPLNAEKEFELKRQQCIDEYIYVVYDYMKKHKMGKGEINVYINDWFERCYDVDWGISKEDFQKRVKELGYGEPEFVV